MKRLFRLLPALLPALFLSGCRDQGDGGEELGFLRNPGADYAPAVATADLFPLTPGRVWSYRIDGSKAVEEVRAGADGTLTTTRGGQVVQTERCRVDAVGVWLVGSDSQPVQPALPLLALPLEEERVSEWQGTLGAGAGQAWTRATRRESVATPAGTFDAWRVDTRTDLTRGERREIVYTTRWLAPGVGVVRVRIASAGRALVKSLMKTNKIETSGVK